jgi:hypothetical protein
MKVTLPFQTSSVAEMHRKLQDSEVMASSIRTPRNHLRPSALVELFDERKALASRFELERLAGRYNMDVNVMERLARYVNTPSISEAGTHTTVSGDNEQVKKMLVSDSAHCLDDLLKITGPLGVAQVCQRGD